ncbi:hypothetical protein SAMN04489733_2280 [Amycolatopsis keratiniphila]|nr:hypothetical protein SAMN04489733_2280 [Amycolatopsis keratiniphila]
MTFSSASAHVAAIGFGQAAATVDGMKELLLAAITRVLAVLLLIPAWLVSPGRARRLACGWALALRFPAENLAGLTPGTLAAFTDARTEAFWRHRTLLGVTSGHRDAAEQHRLFLAEAGRKRVLPPKDSAHVRGTALDVRPREGAQWLEDHGARFALYRIYDNEWWHFEYRPGEVPPERLPHPGWRAGVSR